jgi:GNAT superfamily N-acetyltransferase
MKTKLPAGYRISVVDYEDSDGVALPMSARDCRWKPFFVLIHTEDDDEIAHAEVYHHGPEKLLMINDVWVDPEHRRRGLANVMYLEAERMAGKPVHPYPGQYEDGRAFWLQPNRPFGRGIANPEADVIRPGG